MRSLCVLCVPVFTFFAVKIGELELSLLEIIPGAVQKEPDGCSRIEIRVHPSVPCYPSTEVVLKNRIFRRRQVRHDGSYRFEPHFLGVYFRRVSENESRHVVRRCYARQVGTLALEYHV